MKHTFLLSIAILLLGLTLTGCLGLTRAYDPSIPKSETATITSQGVRLEKVNDIEIGYASSGARIAPGTNSLVFSIEPANYYSPIDDKRLFKVKLEAKAGVDYKLTSARGNPNICAYPIDPKSGKVLFDQSAGCSER